MERKKPFSFKLTKQDKIIGAVVAVALVACSVDLSISRIKAGNELAYKLGVKDAVVSGDNLRSPYKLTESKFAEVIKADSYLSSKYNFEDKESDSLLNLDNKQLYSREHSYSLIGKNADTNEVFQASVTTYNRFTNPTSLTLIYPYTDDSELDSIKESYSEIVRKLYNKEIEQYINKNSQQTFNGTVPSKSGDFKIDIYKGIQDFGEERKELVVIIDYNEVNVQSLGVEGYKDETKTAYNNIELFKDTKIEDMAEVYANSLGDHKECRITTEASDIGTYEDGEAKSSSIGLRTVFNDSSATELSLTIVERENADPQISVITSSKYEKTREETIAIVENMVSSLTGCFPEIKDILSQQDNYNGETNFQYGEGDLKVKLNIQIMQDIYGTYATISMYN